MESGDGTIDNGLIHIYYYSRPRREESDSFVFLTIAILGLFAIDSQVEWKAESIPGEEI